MNTEIESTESKPVSLVENAKRFASFVFAGINSWIQAGNLLCNMKDDDSNAFEKINTLYPAISIEMLLTFERIGRKQIYPYLLLDNSPGCRRAIELPYEEQVRAYARGVEIVTSIKGDSPTIETKRIQSLTANEASMVFVNGEIRNTDRQLATLKIIKGVTKETIRKPFGEQKSLGMFRIKIINGKPCLVEEKKAGKVKIKILIHRDSKSSDCLEIKEK